MTNSEEEQIKLFKLIEKLMRENVFQKAFKQRLLFKYKVSSRLDKKRYQKICLGQSILEVKFVQLKMKGFYEQLKQTMFLEAKQENHQEFQTNDEQHIENIKQILNLDHKNLESHESLIVKKLPQTIRNRIKKLTIGKNEFLKYYKDIITKISEKIQTNKLKIDCSKLSILKSPEFSIKFDFLPMFSECEQTSSKYLLRNIESAFQEVQDNFENQFYGLEDQFSCQNIQNYSFGDRSDNVYISLSQTESLCTSNDQSFASYLKDDNQSLRSIDVQRIDPYSEENFKKFLQPLRSLLKRKKNIQVKRKILSQFENLKCKYKKYI